MSHSYNQTRFDALHINSSRSVMNKKLAVALTVVLLSGCMEVVAPGAEKIVLTDKPALVAKCRPVGSLQVAETWSAPGDEDTELRNQALGLGTGADTALVTTPAFAAHATGMAYRCNDAAASGTP